MFISDCYNYACTFSDLLPLTLQRPPFSRIYSQSLLYMGSLTTEVLKTAGEFRHWTPHFCLHQHWSNSTTFAAQIKFHSETLDRFKEIGGGDNETEKMKPQQKDYDKKKKKLFKLNKSKCLSIGLKYMYDQLLRASDNAMRTSSLFHPLVLQGE